MNYDELPEGIRVSVTRDGYRWTPDKERLVSDMLTPDLEDDLEDDE